LNAIPAPRRRPHLAVLARRLLGLLRHGGPASVSRRFVLAHGRSRVERAPLSSLFAEYLANERALGCGPSTGGGRRSVSVGVARLPPLEYASHDTDAVAAALSGDAEVLILVREREEPLPAAAEICGREFGQDVRLAALLADEQCGDGGAAYPLLRPGWSDDLFRHAFDPGSAVVIRAEAARQAGGPRREAGPAALFDLLLRLHTNPGAVRHIQRILVRRGGPGIPESQAVRETIDRAHREVLVAWIERSGDVAQVTPGLAAGTRRIRRPLRPGLRVAAIVPTRDGGRLLSRCVASLVALPEPRPAVVLVDNGSRSQETLSLLASYEKEGRAQVLRRPGPFNFSALMNAAAREVTADLLVFLNDDTEARSPEAVSALCEEAVRPDVAAVGGLLLYPDGRIQHAGLVTGMGIVAGHLYKGMEREGPSWFVSPLVAREVSAVDGACFMVRRDLFLRLGGFDEVALPISFSDVDFCLRARQEGFRIVYTPFSEFLHEETATRDPELDPREIRLMERRWGHVLAKDPFYHSGLTLCSETARPDPWRRAAV